MANHPAVQTGATLLNPEEDIEEKLAKSSPEIEGEYLEKDSSSPVTGDDIVEEPITDDLKKMGLREVPIIDQFPAADPNGIESEDNLVDE